MTDVNKSKLQVRSGLSLNGDKSPSPATRLLINHGKPNFTIQRSLRTQNGKVNPTSPPTANVPFNIQNDNNELVVKSTMFNGVFKPSNMSVAAKQTLTKNDNVSINNDTENEATKVVLRRPKFMQTEIRGQDDENVPEFIRRQRRIQERLANQNILDFENRRSGYFTQVVISPSSPNRQSFAETMSSPAVKPGLELPLPTAQHEGTTAKESKHEQRQQPEVENNSETIYVQPVTPLNGQAEEEEVAKAIEEVNKAVEGEDDDKIEFEHVKNSQQDSKQNIESTDVAGNIIESVEEIQSEDEEKQQQRTVTLETPSLEDNSLGGVVEVTSSAEITEQQLQQPNGQVEAEFTLTSAHVIEENIERSESNNLADQHNQNGHLIEKTLDSGITISHTNDENNCILPTSDPKIENSANFEPKTVVSFSQELGNGDNKYPDTVRVVQDVGGSSEVDSSLNELTKLKFEIKANDQDIEVNPIIITTETV